MIYLVRHGQTQFNAIRRAQGALDSSLTDLGLRQAAQMGVLLKSLVKDPAGCPITCSPQGRAVHTAQLIQQAMGNTADLVQDSRLREVTLGSWDGLTYAEIEAGWPGVMSGPDGHFKSPDGERYDAMKARLADWLDEARQRPGEQIAVSHGVAGRILRGLVGNLSADAALSLPVPQDAVFRIWQDQVDRIDCAPAN